MKTVDVKVLEELRDSYVPPSPPYYDAEVEVGAKICAEVVRRLDSIIQSAQDVPRDEVVKALEAEARNLDALAAQWFGSGRGHLIAIAMRLRALTSTQSREDTLERLRGALVPLEQEIASMQHSAKASGLSNAVRDELLFRVRRLSLISDGLHAALTSTQSRVEGEEG